MSGGGKPGPCTGESSIKSQLEIWNELKDADIKPNYETSTHTYWYNKVRLFYVAGADAKAIFSLPPGQRLYHVRRRAVMGVS
jgi:hypothetical protein